MIRKNYAQIKNDNAIFAYLTFELGSGRITANLIGN